MKTATLTRTYANCRDWFDMWGRKYESLLRDTFLQSSHWGVQTLAQFYGGFDFYDDSISPLKPHVLQAHEATPFVWFEYVYDINCRKPISDEQLHNRAVERLRKVEAKLERARNAILQVK